MTPGSLIRPSSDRTVSLAARYAQVRALTDALVAPLGAEDCVVQSMPDASPAKWHLAHTTWFFEQFLLLPHLPAYRVFHERFSYLFNSYYESIGPRHERPARGLLTRPTLDQVRAYRDSVDESMARLIAQGPAPDFEKLVELGLQHEQQHQELLLMDIKHLLSCNPLQPAYVEHEHAHVEGRGSESLDGETLGALGGALDPTGTSANEAATLGGVAPSRGLEHAHLQNVQMQFRPYPEGIYEIGYDGGGFCFDNEMPRHREYVQPFAIATRLVTNGEYLEFIRERGYERAELWLSDGWTAVQQHQWKRPLYWAESLDTEFTLTGARLLDPQVPVSHVSFYEADAFARWANSRLPTESEWEIVAARRQVAGNFLEDDYLHPRPARASHTNRVVQLFGDLWEWTRSSYSPYPGFRPVTGALGEYNGKFMANQFVLRGGSCVTPASHVRPTYRNFFYPHMRWQFGGIRLARDARS